MADTDTPPAVAPLYKEDDLVYVDPDAKTVVGLVEWNTAGRPKALAMKSAVVEIDDEPAAEPGAKPKGRVPMRPRRIRYYPWGTYRSMKRVYKLEGKPVRVEQTNTLEEVIEKALKEPFWD